MTGCSGGHIVPIVNGLQLDDRVGPLALWRRDLHVVANLLVQQRPSERRADRDQTRGSVDLLGKY